jgi:single-stranded DNA-binding protein
VVRRRSSEVSINILVISGVLATDPVISTSPTGKPLGKARVGVKKLGVGENTTMWINITAWDRNSERLATYKKGSFVTVQGRLDISSTKNPDGTYRNYCGVTVNEFLTTEGHSPSAGSDTRAAQPPAPRPAPAAFPEDDPYASYA